jgi:hypothetical protein
MDIAARGAGGGAIINREKKFIDNEKKIVDELKKISVVVETATTRVCCLRQVQG